MDESQYYWAWGDFRGMTAVHNDASLGSPELSFLLAVLFFPGRSLTALDPENALQMPSRRSCLVVTITNACYCCKEGSPCGLGSGPSRRVFA